MRIVAIDFGTKRVGLAISDPDEKLALALPMYEWQEDGNDAARLAGIAEEAGAQEIVVGLPINMDDTIGPSAKRVLSFVEELRQFAGVPVETWDERLSSEEARARLRDVELSRRRKREHTNTVAAQVILEGYLQARRTR
ncbi:MAG: Holliday junction resolvase RuvX [Planctomycetes bacterium]|nr:Holliday junction resolvase RuvX [Planctomycetota bacterium]